MNKFATIVAQNEQICKEEAPPPHVEPPLMWKLQMWKHHYVEAPHMLSTMVAQNAILCNHGCAKCKFAQPSCKFIQICKVRRWCLLLRRWSFCRSECNMTVPFPSAGGRRSFFDSRSLGLANSQSAFSKPSKVHLRTGHIIDTSSQNSTA